MRRFRAEEDRSAGQDSFLDVITNIVGILIILVMVIGARVRQVMLETPKLVVTPEITALAGEVESLGQTLISTEREIEGLQAQVRTLEAAAAGASDARLELATAVAAGKLAVAERKAAADNSAVEAAERAARRRSLEERMRLCSLETKGLAHAAATTEEVLAYPTPIGRTVNGEEIHFRLAGGRVAYVPLDELFDLAKSHTRRNSNSITQLSSRIVTVGPEQGFALDYVIEAKVDAARGQVLIRSREWVVRPADAAVGEPVEQALGPRSRFRGVLGGAKPETTVTLWCYPDSFDAYRLVRAELHRLGVPTAGRPLPDGAPIGGSTEGSKSVVQ